MVASGTAAHLGGMYAGRSGSGVGVSEGAGVSVGKAVGVTVGGKTICVTKLHDNIDKIKSPKPIRLIIIPYL
jgi:hypothetical protein